MHARTLILLTSLLASPAAAQTDVLYTIDRPAGVGQDWGSRLFALSDLDGDGVGELGLGTRTHGAGVVAWVHSGAGGALLFELAVPNVPLFFGQNLVPFTIATVTASTTWCWSGRTPARAGRPTAGSRWSRAATARCCST